MKTKYKHNAEPRSIALVSLLQGSILGSAVIILKHIVYYENVNTINSENNELKYLIAIPLGFILWSLNERYFRKKSTNNYEPLRREFNNIILNKLMPFWLIFLLPWILFFGTIFTMSIFE